MEGEKIEVKIYSDSEGGINRGWLLVLEKWDKESRERGKWEKNIYR